MATTAELIARILRAAGAVDGVDTLMVDEVAEWADGSVVVVTLNDRLVQLSVTELTKEAGRQFASRSEAKRVSVLEDGQRARLAAALALTSEQRSGSGGNGGASRDVASYATRWGAVTETRERIDDTYTRITLEGTPQGVFERAAALQAGVTQCYEHMLGVRSVERKGQSQLRAVFMYSNYAGD
jgi:hypothetical protein